MIIKKNDFSLLTDLYELTMVQGYFFQDPNQEGVFDYFFRNPPFNGGYTIFAGLEPLLNIITSLNFSDKQLNYLKKVGFFKENFLEYLSNFNFSGDIYAIKEGSIVFPNQPIIRVEGKLVEIQLLESMILNILNFQSLIATKTARIIQAANGGPVLEFGLRRAQGIDGSLSATRSSFIGGASSTSNVLAGEKYSIPVSGTMAHSWVMSFPSELEAFEKFAEIYPDNCILLIDTYDTLKAGIINAIKVFKKLKKSNKKNLKMGVRLDSGDLDYLSKKVRKKLDENNLKEVKIFASNELDEYIINQLVKSKAPIDAWGVGTKLVTGDKDPSLSGVYKIVAKSNSKKSLKPVIKLSNNPEKMTNPGRKNILRFYDKNNQMLADLIYLEKEKKELTAKLKNKSAIKLNHPTDKHAYIIMKDYNKSEHLLKKVLENGKRVTRKRNLKEIQKYTKQQLSTLHSTYKRLINPHIYKVSLSDKLSQLKKRLCEKHSKNLDNINF